MKPLLTLLTLMLCCTFARADVATDLAALKAAFPEYVPAEKNRNDPSDPVVKECVERYTKTVRSITPATIAQNAKYMADQIERDIAKYEQQTANVDPDSKSSGKAYWAAKNNMHWLKKKVKPWVAKLAAVK